jgi:hypothetical protein
MQYELSSKHLMRKSGGGTLGCAHDSRIDELYEGVTLRSYFVGETLFTVSPDGAALLSILRAEEDSSARRWTPRIYLDAYGLRFEIAPRVVEEGGAAIRGPYCGGCRRIQGHASFSDWSTSEREDITLPPLCRACGKVFTNTQRDLKILAVEMATLFKQHVRKLEGR